MVPSYFSTIVFLFPSSFLFNLIVYIGSYILLKNFLKYKHLILSIDYGSTTELRTLHILFHPILTSTYEEDTLITT